VLRLTEALLKVSAEHRQALGIQTQAWGHGVSPYVTSAAILVRTNPGLVTWGALPAQHLFTLSCIQSQAWWQGELPMWHLLRSLHLIEHVAKATHLSQF
jgi:hypothetical protein